MAWPPFSYHPNRGSHTEWCSTEDFLSMDFWAFLRNPRRSSAFSDTYSWESSWRKGWWLKGLWTDNFDAGACLSNSRPMVRSRYKAGLRVMKCRWIRNVNWDERNHAPITGAEWLFSLCSYSPGQLCICKLVVVIRLLNVHATSRLYRAWFQCSLLDLDQCSNSTQWKLCYFAES